MNRENLSNIRYAVAFAFIAGSSVILFSQAVRRVRRKTSIPTNGVAAGVGLRNDSQMSVDDSEDENALMDSPVLDGRLLRKAEAVIRGRTSRLILVIERCTNDHNFSAILRTAEALGLQHVWLISPPCRAGIVWDAEAEAEEVMGGQLVSASGKKVKNVSEIELKVRAMHHLFAQRATEWLTIREFTSTTECLKTLKEDGIEVWATDLSQEAVCLDDIHKIAQTRKRNQAVPDRLAVVMGTEAVGCTTEMLKAADLRVYLPLRGFAESLNLSVAAALVVHQIFNIDPTLIGAMAEEERQELRKKWYVKLASQRIVTKKERKERSRLFAAACAADRLEEQISEGKTLKPNQVVKLEHCKSAKAQLEALDLDLQQKAELAVKEFLADPPDPITDLRRADTHRQTFAGKKTKAKFPEWKDMPATTYAQTIQLDDAASTAKFFREKIVDSKEAVASKPVSEPLTVN